MTDSNRDMTLRFLAQPTDVNFGGKVHGGAVMKWLDQAGYACATAWSGHYCVTVFVGDMNFRHPVHVGDLVEVHAKVIHTGRTSLHIALTLRARHPMRCAFSRALRCIMVFVAVDEEGKPVEVPPWTPETEEDIALKTYALKIMELRKQNRDVLAALPD